MKTLISASHSHLHLDGRMRIVVADLKVFHAKIVDALHFPQDLQLRERPDLPLELQIEPHRTECKLKGLNRKLNTGAELLICL